MPSFLLPLLTLVSSFNFGIGPVIHPPVLPMDIDFRGQEVSALIKDLRVSISPSPDKTERSNTPNKEAAYNDKSGKEMPTTLPLKAIDSSKALSPLPTSGANATSENGNSNHSQSGSTVSGPGVIVDTSSQKPDNEDHDLSLGKYDAPGFSDGSAPAGSSDDTAVGPQAPNPGDYKPLEIHGPNGIVTVSY